MKKYYVIIAGAGPAGLVTALHLLQLRPQLSGCVAAIERARHPRPKVCAGGLIPRVITTLRALGVSVQVPAVRVFAGSAVTEVGGINLEPSSDPLCTIIRRDEFDAMLLEHAQAAGLEIIDNTRVLAVRADKYKVGVETTQGSFESRVLVGADGSGSRVRTSVFGQGKHNLGRALIVELPVPDRQAEGFKDGYRFNFNCVAAGVRGYCWSFPCLISGEPHLNLGIYDQSPGGARAVMMSELLRQLHVAFPELNSSRVHGVRLRIKSFPIRWYDPSDRYTHGRVILAGDAAGVDPLMGEGISYALEHGRLAGAAIARYLDGDHTALDAYGLKLHQGMIGRKLKRLAFAARRFYGPHHRFYFRLARSSSRLQRIAVDWYNGARGLDEMSITRAALRFLLHGSL